MAQAAEKRDSREAGRKRPPADERPRIAFGRTNYALFGAAALVLVAGYVLLDRGSITLAPILLVLGYVVLLPAAILIRRDLPGE
ncbi:MAG TPA: hypothetical protein VIC59_07160 [Gemmatimonadota bacterium]|jgi:hypothetical protein